jgi:hypothetical protein
MSASGDKRKREVNGIAFGLIFGPAVGISLMAATDNPAWLAIGIGVGLCLGAAFEGSKRKRREEEGTDDRGSDDGG